MKTIILFLTITISTFSFGQKIKEKIDFTEYVKYLSQTKTDGQDFKMSMWMPLNYLDLSAKARPDYDPEVIKFLEELFDGYTLVMIYSGEIDTDNQMFVSESASTTRNKVYLEFQGKKYKPLTDSQLTDELSELTESIKPMINQMVGSLGPGMNLFFFDVRDDNNKSLIDPYKDNDFKIKIEKEIFHYNLPVPALFEDKKCEIENETYPSNYNYCPIHGNQLK